jgi:hypothetical protein
MSRWLAVPFAVVVCLLGNGTWPAPARAQAPATTPATPVTLSRAEMETFLAKAKIVRTRGVSKGITGTIRATLSDGRLTHDASIQRIDEFRHQFTGTTGTEFNFRDTWRFNVAAYELDKLLDLNMVPVSVERRFERVDSSFTWWVDDVMMDEAERMKKKVQPPDIEWWNQQMAVVRVFDQLIHNVDRNLGNLLITAGWRVWMIDHSRAFRWNRELREAKNLTRCDRRLLERLRTLDARVLQEALGQYVGDRELAALLVRRDLIVGHFDKAGEKALYDAPRDRSR